MIQRVTSAKVWTPAIAVALGMTGVAQAAPIYDPVRGVTYSHNSAVQTWSAARTAAIGLGGDLVRIDNADVNAAARAASNNVGGWINATDQAVEGEWRWADNGDQFWQGLAANNATPGSAVGGRYNNWRTGEPNNVGDEDFGVMNTDGTWNDGTAAATATSIRQLPGNQAAQSFGGKFYTIITAATWNTARTRAQAMGGDLVRIDDAAENNFVAGLLAGSGGVTAWIGGNDQTTEGQWVWSQGNTQFWQGLAANNTTTPGSAVGGLYSNWNGGEPNDSGGEDFAEIQSTGGWNDLNASATRMAVVEVVPEPTSLALLGIASVGMLARRRRTA